MLPRRASAANGNAGCRFTPEGQGRISGRGGSHGWTINHRPVDLPEAPRLIAGDSWLPVNWISLPPFPFSHDFPPFFPACCHRRFRRGTFAIPRRPWRLPGNPRAICPGDRHSGRLRFCQPAGQTGRPDPESNQCGPEWHSFPRGAAAGAGAEFHLALYPGARSGRQGEGRHPCDFPP